MEQKLSLRLIEARQMLKRSVVESDDVNIKLIFLEFDSVLTEFLTYVDNSIIEIKAYIDSLKVKIQ